MSEYQYYEFEAIDNTLTQAQRKAISELSSRVKPTSTTAIFNYSYGDLPGKPEQVLIQYFDAMYYVANWGVQQLMFKFPKALISQAAIEPYCIKNCIELSFVGDWAILNWEFGYPEGFEDWIEGEDTLCQLVGLREEILKQDYRGLYLGWLKAITLAEEYIEDTTQLEPPVPPGLTELSPVQKSFTEIFAIDESLVITASAASGGFVSILTDEILQQQLTKLSATESKDFLLRLAKGEPNLSTKLKQKLLGKVTITNPVSTYQRRTIQELLDGALQEEERAEERRKKAAEVQRIQELHDLIKREVQVWDEVELLIQKAQSKAYDQAVELLTKLRDLAVYQNKYATFQKKAQSNFCQ